VTLTPDQQKWCDSRPKCIKDLFDKFPPNTQWTIMPETSTISRQKGYMLIYKDLNIVMRAGKTKKQLNPFPWCALFIYVFLYFAVLFTLCTQAHAEVNIPRLADAIYQAEGGAKTKHPYGILKKFKHTTPRQACINTIKTNLKKWNGQGDFISFLGRNYCPVGSNTDNGTCKYWVKNVKSIMETL
jgi:hypothetical protein